MEKKGQYFINGKPLEIADQIDWEAFHKEIDKNMFEAALECAEKENEQLKYPGLLHISSHP